MTDEPENHTIRLLQEMREEMRGGFREAQGRLDRLEETVVKVIDAVTAIASTQTEHTAILTELNGRMEVVEGRLNSVDARLARIEKHTGLVKA